MVNKDWGPACWYVFHTLAYRLKEEKQDLVGQLLNQIKNICTNLPCPDCASHATAMMNNLKHNSVRDKKQLVDMLWLFHNSVNTRNNKNTFSKEEHDAMYSSADIKKVVMYFQQVMVKQLGQDRAMVLTMARRNAVKAFIEFYKDNHDAFA
jgi:hypothetical protein